MYGLHTYLDGAALQPRGPGGGRCAVGRGVAVAAEPLRVQGQGQGIVRDLTAHLARLHVRRDDPLNVLLQLHIPTSGCTHIARRSNYDHHAQIFKFKVKRKRKPKLSCEFVKIYACKILHNMQRVVKKLRHQRISNAFLKIPTRRASFRPYADLNIRFELEG